MPGASAVALAAALTVAAAPPAEGPAVAPGGYWGVNEKREPEPDDGRTKLTIGAILLPLGLLRTGAGITNVVTTTGEGCARIYGFDEQSCSSFRIYGWWGVGFGGLMTVTGAVFLGIGLAERSKHDAWRRRYGIAVAPMLGPRGSGLTLRMRF